MKNSYTPKQRMLNAYRGIKNDRLPVAPEFWYYYPAKLLGVDMIEFQRTIPFHQALKTTFKKFGCEGWGIAFCNIPAPDTQCKSVEKWIDKNCLEVRTETKTAYGTICGAQRYHREEPSWVVERPIKDIGRDMAAWKQCAMADPENMDVSALQKVWQEVGESYLVEVWMGVPFFDFYADGRQGGMETAVMDFFEHEAMLEKLQREYIEYMVRKTRFVCEKTPFESLCIGCSWSCNSLIGPKMWRKWDKPVIAAVANEAHRNNRLLHIHFHGKCMETVADFAEIGIDCVCPFERPPGGDVVGLAGLRQVAQQLNGKTTMNGNIHTVETLIRGTPADVCREVREVIEAFKDNPRVIVGTGDQVGRETPAENIHAMIQEAHSMSVHS